MMSVVGLNASNPDIKRGVHRTWIFWQLTRQSLLMRPTPWRQTTGFAPRSSSSFYFTVHSTSRLYTQHSNSEVQLELGGLHTLPPYLQIITSHGANSILLSAHIIYLQVCSAQS
jgi:hypothetical protein